MDHQDFKPIVFNSNEKKDAICRMITRKINSIVDNGHPQLLKIAFTLGGYVGGGYLTKDEAENLIHNLIEQNSYLSKGISGYKKTASSCIRDGLNKPLYFGY